MLKYNSKFRVYVSFSNNTTVLIADNFLPFASAVRIMSSGEFLSYAKIEIMGKRVDVRCISC